MVVEKLYHLKEKNSLLSKVLCVCDRAWRKEHGRQTEGGIPCCTTELEAELAAEKLNHVKGKGKVVSLRCYI